MKKLKGNITISRRSDDVIIITIEDVDSSCVIIETEMSIYNFGSAIMGLGMLDCAVYYNNSGNIGKKREYKTVVVPAIEKVFSEESNTEINEHMMTFPEIANLFKEHWEPRYDDFRNFHNKGKDGYRVIFERWVYKEVK